MKAKDLNAIWAAPDNTRLTNKQFSLRLPVHVAAKISALCEMHPNKSRTQIMCDLLSSALTELEESLPRGQGRSLGNHPEADEEMFEEAGVIHTFRTLTDHYYIELEKELGNEDPKPYFGPRFVFAESEK